MGPCSFFLPCDLQGSNSACRPVCMYLNPPSQFADSGVTIKDLCVCMSEFTQITCVCVYIPVGGMGGRERLTTSGGLP